MGAYQPIALLRCMSKVFETLLTQHSAHWAATSQSLAEWHTGGWCQHNTDDALVPSTLRIKHKWRKCLVVSGLFLYVKSAYLLVHRDRPINTLRKKEFSAYLVRLVHSFLTGRTTCPRPEDYQSREFKIANGLPQGSPLSLMLYLIYNSNLLIEKPVSLNSQQISLGFIDDTIHLISWLKRYPTEHRRSWIRRQMIAALGKKPRGDFWQEDGAVDASPHRKHTNP